MRLEDLGWKPAHEQAFRQHSLNGVRPCRVSAVHAQVCRVLDPEGEYSATLAGSFREQADRPDLPTVGDWVVFEPNGAAEGVIRGVLPRLTCLSRKSAGRTSEVQPLAANVDRVLLVMAFGGDYNLRRLERALVMVAHAGAAATVLLNKCDLEPRAGMHADKIRAQAPGIPVLTISARRGDGMDELVHHLGRGETFVLLGSSGAGKSTIANHLLAAERQATGPVREHDHRGRHVTTSRQLVVLPSGALLIDTPGIREIQLAVDEEALEAVFEDVRHVAQDCRFRDCAHTGEPGCAVQGAIESGALDGARLASLHKLERERAQQAERSDPERQRERKARWKAIHKEARRRPPRGSE